MRALRATNAGEVNISRSVLPHRCCTAHSSPTATPLYCASLRKRSHKFRLSAQLFPLLCKNRRGEKCTAFTLAEVLITLTIIGVIAALTIPTLSRKWSDHADVAKVKETISILSNAMKMAIAENGPVDSWYFTTGDKNVQISNMFAKYLKSNCRAYDCKHFSWGSGENAAYRQANNGYYKSLKGDIMIANSPDNNYSRPSTIQLKNGAYVYFSSSYLPNIRIFFDINGVKKPAQMGYDIFLIDFSNYGVSSFVKDKNSCNRYGGASSTSPSDGLSCAYWVIKHGNMDYKYRDVSAEW